MTDREGTRQQNGGSMGAVIYCRVSTREQAEEGVSLGSQERTCRDFCRQRGWPVKNVFVERGESARTTDRPEFTEMIRWCRVHKGQLDALLVYKLDRFCRNKAQFFALQALLASYGIRIISATEPVEEDSPVARLLEGILASIGEFESDLIADRTRNSMEHARSSGRPTHRPPLGYLMGRERGGAPTMTPDPDRAGIVRKGFELFGTGLFSVNEIVRMMNADGLTTRHGKKLSVQSLHRMLRNPVYSGMLVVSEQRGSAAGNFEGLVSREVFDRVQAVLRGRGTIPTSRRDTDGFPLRYSIRCGACGKYLTGGWSTGRAGRRYAYYYCYRPGCRAVHACRDTLEQAFLGYLDQFAEGTRRNASLCRTLRNWAVSWAPEAEALRFDRTARIAVIEEQLSRLTRAFIYDQALDHEHFMAEKDRLGEEALLLKLDLEDLPDPEEAGVSTEVSLWLSGHAGELVYRTAPKYRLQLQRTLFPDGLVVDPSAGTVRTALTNCRPNVWMLSNGGESRMATPTGLEPVSPA